MPDKLTDKEIKKALECCIIDRSCKDCPYYENGKTKVDDCLGNACELTLDLINRLEEKNSNLTSDLTSLQNDLTSAKAEVERLHKNPTIPTTGFLNLLCGALIVTETLEEYNKFRRTFKAEAYKECIEKVKKELSFGKYITPEQLDNLLKEMGVDDNV